MKKSNFYAIVSEEFALLLGALRSADPGEQRNLYQRCVSRHRALCLRLLRDFITPMDRGDLYEISKGILSVFSTVFQLSSRDRNRAEQGVLILSADPFRFDETALFRWEKLREVSVPSDPRSDAGNACFSALDRLGETLFLAAVKNA